MKFIVNPTDVIGVNYSSDSCDFNYDDSNDPNCWGFCSGADM